MVKCFYKGRNGVSSLGEYPSTKEFLDMREALASAIGLKTNRLPNGVLNVYEEDRMLGTYYTRDA